MMQLSLVVCWTLLVLVGADECPDGGRCGVGQTCCNDPETGYECCPFDRAECCEDHIHCCPMGTTCDSSTSSCVNATVSIPWVERVSADRPRLSKSFRMIKSYKGEEKDNICPDQSQCPPEFSCLRSLTQFGCCPLAQGVPCSDGKHCCPEGHQCTEDSHSCIKKEVVTEVICDDKSECPDGTTCCINPDGSYGCCPLSKAVCCEDKVHCCPEGTACDVPHSTCVYSSTKREVPMWAKLPARLRAEWENRKDGERVSAESVHDNDDNGGSEKVPDVATVNAVPLPEKEMAALSVARGSAGVVPCTDKTACPDGNTCCKTKEGGWTCCPSPQAVCCADFIHCCPHGKRCNMVTMNCDDDSYSVPLMKKIPTIPRQAVLVGKEEKQEHKEDDRIHCDDQTTCPESSTCCFMKSFQRWGCCPLPEAVCCADGSHCCPADHKCNEVASTCVRGDVVIPWYTKFPASSSSIQADPSSVQCDSFTQCPQDTTCCQLVTGEWGCCPSQHAVCCPDKKHCCPQGYTCDTASNTCHKVVTPWLETVPLTLVYLAEPRLKDVKCDEQSSCPDGQTCCRTSSTSWGCCPLPNAVCCSDMQHCCKEGYTCSGSGECIKSTGLLWYNWLERLANRKKAQTV